MGATIGRGVTVESFGVVASGATVSEGVTVPSGQVWAGSPAHYLRDVSQEEKHHLNEFTLEMQQLSQVYSDETEKSFREIIDHRDEHIKYITADVETKTMDKLQEYGLPMTHDDMEYIEHRVYHDYLGTVDLDIRDENHTAGAEEKAWIPYEQDMTHYPEVFKRYQDNYKRYDELKNKFETETLFQEQSESPFTRKIPKDLSPWEKKYDMLMPKFTGGAAQ